MTSNTQFQAQEQGNDYPIYTIRWLAIHTLGVPTVWFLGAIAAMQFLDRSAGYPGMIVNESLFGIIDPRVALFTAPILLSILWNILLFGKPTVQEFQKILKN